MDWKDLIDSAQLDAIDKASEDQPVLIFKHSTRCNISGTALDRLERKWKDDDDQKVQPFLLDLLNHRDLSNLVAQRYNIEHQSPQVLLIRNGRCIFTQTHWEIDHNNIMDKAATS